VKFIRISLIQILSRFLTQYSKAQELLSPFTIPCRVIQLVIISKVIAKQYGLKCNNLIVCSNGQIYRAGFFDIGSSLSSIKAVQYILIHGFGIRGHDAYLLEQILKRSSGIVIEDHGGRISVLYSI